MSVKIFIPPFLIHLTNDTKVASADGNTVGECLNELIRHFPKIKKMILNDDGKLRSSIDVYINGGSAYPDELDKAVKDGDELHIMNVITGG